MAAESDRRQKRLARPTPLGVISVGLRGFAEDLAAPARPCRMSTGRRRPAAMPSSPTLVARLAGDRGDRGGQPRGPAAHARRRAGAGRRGPRAARRSRRSREGRIILHAGPPIEWARMCGPLRGAVCGAIVFEGWATDLAAAEKLAAGGGVAFEPNHHFDAVGPMTGHHHALSRCWWWRTARSATAPTAPSTKGSARSCASAATTPRCSARLAWLRDARPGARQALRAVGGIPLKPLIARGLSMGDEMHQRNVACSSLLCATRARGSRAPRRRKRSLAEALDFIGSNDQFFLNVAMAMGKAITDPARGIERLVHRHRHVPQRHRLRHPRQRHRASWFTAPVEMPDGLYFPGYSAADANPDMGDRRSSRPSASAASPWRRRRRWSASSAPAAADAARFTRTMGEITAGENPEWTIPALDFAGVATGIDMRLRGRDRHRADHQHRHRPPQAGRRPGRRRRRARAAGVLRASRAGAGCKGGRQHER